MSSAETGNINSKLTRALREKASAEARVEELERMLVNLSSGSSSDLEEEVRVLRALLGEKEETIRELSEEIELLDAASKEKDTALQLLQDIVSEREETVSFLTTKQRAEGSEAEAIRTKDATIAQLEIELSTQKGENSVLKSELQKLQGAQKEFAEEQQRRRSAETQVKELEQSVANMKEEMAAQLRRVERSAVMERSAEQQKFQAEIDKLRAKLNEATSRTIPNLEDSLRVAKELRDKDVASMEEEVARLKKELSNVVSQVTASKAAEERANAVLERERTARDALDMTHSQLVAEVETLRREVHEMLQLSSDQSQELAAHLAVISQIRGELDAAERSLQERGAEMLRLEDEAQRLRKQLTLAQSDVRSKDDELVIVRGELAASNQLSGELQRSYDLVSATTRRREEAVRSREEELRKVHEKLTASTEQQLRLEGEVQRLVAECGQLNEARQEVDDKVLQLQKSLAEQTRRHSQREKEIREEVGTERRRASEFEVQRKESDVRAHVELTRVKNELEIAREDLERAQAMCKQRDAEIVALKENSSKKEANVVDGAVSEKLEKLALLERYVATVKSTLIEALRKVLLTTASSNKKATAAPDEVEVAISEMSRTSVVDVANNVGTRCYDMSRQLKAYTQFASDIRAERNSISQILLDDELQEDLEDAEAGSGNVMTDDDVAALDEQGRWLESKQRILLLTHWFQKYHAKLSARIEDESDGDCTTKIKEQRDQLVAAIRSLKSGVQHLRTSRTAVPAVLPQPQLNDVFASVVEGIRIMQSILEIVDSSTTAPSMSSTPTTASSSSKSQRMNGSGSGGSVPPPPTLSRHSKK
eukprot:PhM_4_TR3273/c0_g1_i1/m.10497